MKFEVIDKNGHVIMWTESIECIPAPADLETMTSAGYRYKIDGKIVAKSKVKEAVGRTVSTASTATKSKVTKNTSATKKLF